MSKVTTIRFENFKAISAAEADFEGRTAIVTAGNDKGKTSFLRGIPDRMRFIRPDVIVKNGEAEGEGEMLLDSGEKFIWTFDNEGKDKLVYVTKEGVTKNVTKQIGQKYFPPTFDIDKFLQSSPKEQVKQLQLIVGVDFTDLDNRYKISYDDRTHKNKEAEKFHVKLTEMMKVDYVAPVDLTELLSRKEGIRKKLNDLYQKNKAENDAAREKWNAEKKKIDDECDDHNDAEKSKQDKTDEANKLLGSLRSLGYKGPEVQQWIDDMLKGIQPYRTASELYPKEPEYVTELPDDKELQDVDAEILAASETNTKAKAYTDYVSYKNEVEAAKVEADEADRLVKKIEDERQKMIESAKFPKGVSITAEGITVDGFPLDRNQISASLLYKTALRIASMGLGEVRTLYFDASFLDRKSLEEINAWSNEQDLQLLIEKPDWDGGEIRYELVEN